MKLEEKIKAIKLRKKGKSYGEILEKMKVSKGTLSLWLRGVRLAPEQYKRLYVTLRRRNAYKAAKSRQEQRVERTRQIIKNAITEIELLKGNHLFLIGLMLYWCEGDKSDKAETVKFSNSDPILIKLMMRWFREVCRVEEKRFRVELHIHSLHCRQGVEKYWADLTDIPLSQFHKTQIKASSLRHRRNRLYNGTCAIRISDKDLFRRIKGWKIGFAKHMSL